MNLNYFTGAFSMRRAAVLLLTTLVLGCLGHPARAQTSGSPFNQTAAPEPHYTRQTGFSIPFSLNQQALSLREIQLFVSADRGRTWQFYAREAVSAKQFGFRASRDGEYWFAVKTIDAQGQSPGDDALLPSLVIVVDTTAPQLNFEAKIGVSGEIVASWSASDENISREAVRVEFRPVSSLPLISTPWRQVAVKQPYGLAARNTAQGDATWWPEVKGSQIEVRATVKDQAGNSTEAIRRLSLPRNLADSRFGSTAGGSVLPQDPYTRREQSSAPIADITQQPPARPAPNSSPAPDYSRPRTENYRRADAPPSPRNTPSAGTPSRFSAYGQPASNTPPPGAVFDGGDKPQPTAPRFEMNPEPASSSAAEARSPVGPGRWKDMIPAGDPLRMTNSRRFMLDFDVDAVGPSGVSQVDLWTTRDGGKNWEKWGSDPDNQSPLPVEVDREGVYGFRIVITTGVGFTSPPPKPGDVADIWVGVDLTNPAIQFLSAPLDRENNSGNLIINWEAYDLHLTERPISISYSTRPNGPWTSIAEHLPNTGTYQWRVTGEAQGEIFLRIEARDEAGNVGVCLPPTPISVHGLRPRGRIRNFRPVGE